MASLPAPRPAEVAGNRGPGITAAVLVVAILASIAVALRFVARYTQRIGYGADDILILLALPLAWAMCICTLIGVHYGLGNHIENVPLQHLVKEAQAYYASEIVWAATILFIKLSILSLYVRIFGRLVYLRRLAYGFGIFVSCWSIMVIFVVVFQCHPIEINWNKSIKGTCINQWVFFVIGSTPNVITDFAILIIPLPAVWALNMRTAQRLSIIGIFLLGSLTCVISVVRLATIVRSKNLSDATWTLSYVAIWSCAEPCLGIVAACLPTLRPLFKNFFATPVGSKERAVAKYGSSEFRSAGTGNVQNMPSGDKHPFRYLGDSADETTGVAYSASATSAGDMISGSGTENIPMNTIAVNTSWENRRGAIGKV